MTEENDRGNELGGAEKKGLQPGGSPGGDGLFLMGGGLILGALGLYLLLDSVRVVSSGFGLISGAIGGGRAGWETTSMGVVFVPFVVGVATLFFDATKRWAWVLSGLGLVVVVVEILSRIQFVMNIKTTHLLIILVMMAAGAGMVARAYRAGQRGQ